MIEDQGQKRLSCPVKSVRLPSLKAKDYGLLDDEKLIYGDRFPYGYQKMELLGRGGFAIVWLGQSGIQKVAIKQIAKPAISKDLRFQHIKSDNIIQILGNEQTQKDQWIIQELGGKTMSKTLYTLKGEFYKGERVYSIIDTNYMKELKESPFLFQQLLLGILNGIAAIDANNVTHCDLKPDNILIDSNGPKIIDFGSAFHNDDAENFGMVTPEYMAPEVLDILHNWSKYSQQFSTQIEALQQLYGHPHIDIWSYGAIILDMINGVPNWLSYKGKIVRNGQIQIKYGLFAVKAREYDKIIAKQQQLNINSIVRNNCQFLPLSKQALLEDVLRLCLTINPIQRITPKQLLKHDFFKEIQ